MLVVLKRLLNMMRLVSIVDIGDSTSASEYALQLLSNKELYNKMQTAMLKDIDERFGSELITDQYEHYYRKMLNQKED